MLNQVFDPEGLRPDGFSMTKAEVPNRASWQGGQVRDDEVYVINLNSL